MAVKKQACRLEIESLDLGSDVKAIGLELIDAESREPVVGGDAAAIWAALLPALAGEEPWVIDFFAHVERAEEFCRNRGIAFRDPNAKTLIIEQSAAAPLAELFERFERETFGIRAGQALAAGDPVLEGELASKGVDAYHPAYHRYLFCAVCDFENGFLTLLSGQLWTSEVIRRARRVMEGMSVEVDRPA